MANALLFILHGRRTHVPQSNLALLHAFSAHYALPTTIGFLEGDQQTLEMGVATLAQRADHLIVVPVLLFAATHVRQDIPHRLHQALPDHVSATVLAPLGPTQAIADYTRTVLQQAHLDQPQRRLMIVTHGTPHYPEPLAQLAKLSVRVAITLGQPVNYASLMGSRLIATAIDASTPLVVLPLFLTDGRLVRKVHTQVLACQPDSVFLPPLENHPVITQAIAERLHAAGIDPS